jgi:N-acyl-D-amino-acid deacylase
MYSVVLKNATIIDGSGQPPIHGDIAIEGDKIIRIAENIITNAHTIIDAAGLVVAPGFIDSQNHSDSYWQLFDNPSLDSLRAQGFTTIAVGHCGASLAPLLSQESLKAIQKWHSLEGVNVNWSSFEEFLTTLSGNRFGCNVASLVGYNTLRRGLVGSGMEALGTQEAKTLLHVLEDSLRAGAFGLSTGLSYGHELSVTNMELKDFASLVSEYNGLLSVHLRSEGEQVVESIDEVLELSRETGVAVKISHLKITGKNQWHLFEEVQDKLETAKHQGVKVWFDVYPYDTVWQGIAGYLPSWVRLGGRTEMLNSLRQPLTRRKVLDYLHNIDTKISELLIVSTANKLNVVGKQLSQIAKDLELSSEEALLMLIENGGSEIMVFDQSLHPEHMTALMMHPLSLIATDGAGFPSPEYVTSGVVNDRMVHPRCFGTAPKFLATVRDTNALSLAEAIRKLTAAPAEALGIARRGLIKEGYFADIVIFNPSSIEDTATLTHPYKFPKGLIHVIVNGVQTMHNGVLLKATGGQILKKMR